MNRKGILVLAVITSVLLIAAVFFLNKQGEDRISLSTGKKLLGNVNLDEIEKITLKKGGNKTTLIRTPDGYKVEEKGGYRGNTGKIDALIVDMLSLKGSEWITSKKEKFETLGVKEGSANAEEVSFYAAGGKLLGGVVLGEDKKTKPGQSNLYYSPDRRRYVRILNKDDIFLTSVRTRVEADPSAWLDKLLLDIPGGEIFSIEIKHPDKGDDFVIKANEEGRFKPVNVTGFKNKKEKKNIIISLADGLRNLRMIDVVGSDGDRAKDIDFDHVYIATLKDGRRYSIYSAEKDKKQWLKISVRYNEETAQNKEEGKEMKQASKKTTPEQIAEKDRKRFGGRVFEVGNIGALRYRVSDLYSDD